MLLGQTTHPGADKMVQEIHQAIMDVPGENLQLLFVLVVMNLVAAVVLIWRQHRLARNPVHLATMIRQLKEDSSRQ